MNTNVICSQVDICSIIGHIIYIYDIAYSIIVVIYLMTEKFSAQGEEKIKIVDKK